jgi:ferredoxin
MVEALYNASGLGLPIVMTLANRAIGAPIKLDDPGPYRYEIDLDFCKGCGLCAEECPAARSRWSPRTSDGR